MPSPRDVLARIEWSLRALAQPSHAQHQLYPSFVCIPEELALEFNDALLVARAHLAGEISPVQLGVLEDLDRKLCEMSGPGTEAVWRAEALQSAPEWAEVRTIAARAIELFGWSPDPPPPSPDTFIPGRAT